MPSYKEVATNHTQAWHFIHVLAQRTNVLLLNVLQQFEKGTYRVCFLAVDSKS